MVGDFNAAIEQYGEAVNSLSRAFIDFGPTGIHINLDDDSRQALSLGQP